MKTSLWDVQAELVSRFTAALPDVTVFDGPRIRGGTTPRQFLLVGSDGGDSGHESLDDGLSAEQEPSDLGPGGWRDETGTITCSAWAWSGHSSIAASRAASRAILDTCETVITADPTLSGLLDGGGINQVARVSSNESQRAGGPVVRLVFTVTYRALIT